MNFFISFTVIWFILLQVRNKGQTSSKIISTLNGTRYRFISVTWLLPKSRYHFLSLSTAEFEFLISDLILRESEEKSDMIPHSCVFLSSRHIYSWKCIDIVRRNSILVTPRSGYDHNSNEKLCILCLCIDVFGLFRSSNMTSMERSCQLKRRFFSRLKTGRK